MYDGVVSKVFLEQPLFISIVLNILVIFAAIIYQCFLAMKRQRISILLSRRQKIISMVAGGMICGLVGYTAYSFRLTSYFSDDPATCMNCHIMAPYYATWSHGAHSRNTTCTDCHLPQDHAVRKWLFKGMDGMRHTTIFLMNGESQVIQAIDRSASVIMENCIRCHEQLNTEFVKTGKINFDMAKMGEGKACWDCHRETPHGRNSLSSAPNSLVPYPKAMTPEWLKKSIQKRNNH